MMKSSDFTIFLILFQVALPCTRSVKTGNEGTSFLGEEDLHFIQKFNEKNIVMGTNPEHKNYWPEKLPHTGSLTPYRVLLSSIPELEYFNETEKRELCKDCSSIRIWTLFRHDIRYPSKETSHGMRTRLRNLKESALLKFYENYLNISNSIIDMEVFLTLLNTWEVVEELSKGVVYVSNATLNRRKSKHEKTEELKNFSSEEQSARSKKAPGADEQIDEAKVLTPIGKKEMKAAGKRFKKRFKNLLTKAGPESRLFKFTDCQRTSVSAKKFYTSIYGKLKKGDESWHAPIDTGGEEKEPLLKYDSLCRPWKKNYTNVHQLEAFMTGKEIKNALKGIRDILKFPKKSITFSDGKLLYESCALETAWKKETPWCILMTETYQSVFEYLKDFEFYKNDGPDNQMNKKVGCFLFRDMIKRLIGTVGKDEKGNIIWNLRLKEDETDEGTMIIKPDETNQFEENTENPISLTKKTETIKKISKKFDPAGQTSEHTNPTDENTDEIDNKTKFETKSIKKVTFYFTHLTAVLKFITNLRVHVDETHLTANNYDKMNDRKWRMARIGTFGTNISMILMRCNKSYYILVLHQERPIILPDCDDELCPLDVFLKSYHDSIFNCNYDEMCRIYQNLPSF